MAKIINSSSFADKNAYNKTKTDFIRTFISVKPLDKIEITKPQESRARKFENRKAVTIARIVSKFKTRTIVYYALYRKVLLK